MVLEHFIQIGTAVTIPLFVYNSPEEMAGTKVNAELCRKLIERLPNFAGVVDLSLDWQFMIELMTDGPRLRPGFQLLAGTELLVSPAAIGATGLFAPLAGIAPKLVRALYELCRDQKLFEARKVQEQLAALRQAVARGRRSRRHARHGRDCGEPRPLPVRSMRSPTRSSSASSMQCGLPTSRGNGDAHARSAHRQGSASAR
jgi:4-hydroxy-tetrahydrodipicolinate synthase